MKKTFYGISDFFYFHIPTPFSDHSILNHAHAHARHLTLKLRYPLLHLGQLRLDLPDIRGIDQVAHLLFKLIRKNQRNHCRLNRHRRLPRRVHHLLVFILVLQHRPILTVVDKELVRVVRLRQLGKE